MLVNLRRTDAQRPIACGEVHLAKRVSSNVRERAVDLTELQVFRRRDPELKEPECRKLRGEKHQLFRLRIGKRPEDDAAHDRENSDVCPYAERQSEKYDCGETATTQ